jgi:hypothetical protein
MRANTDVRLPPGCVAEPWFAPCFCCRSAASLSSGAGYFAYP